uniref:ABC transporter permease n=1 Tax=Candidatus Methanomethylicus mesodigestus TaxID=1867258 RepID=A0A7C3FD08_9CREN
MRSSDIFKWGMRGIRQRKLRAALTILGIMVGTAAVIALVSQTEGIQGNILDQVNRLGSNTLTVRPAGAAILTQADVDKISQMPGVDYVIPLSTAAVRISGPGVVKSFAVIGVDPAQFYALVNDAELEEGRLYEPISFSEVVVGHEVKQPQDMVAPLLSIDQSVTLEFGSLSNPSRRTVQVVGTIAPFGSAALINVDESIFMSLRAVMSTFGRSSYSLLFVRTASADAVDSVVSSIKASYGSTVNINTVKQVTETVTSITGALTVLLGAIAGISLFVAGIGITNIMFVSVIERTREIGVLKAVGFKRRDVLYLFLSEAVIVGAVGGAMGIAVGSALSYFIPAILSRGLGRSQVIASAIQSFDYAPSIRPEMVVMVFAFAMAVSIIAGYYPASRASKMDPVVALRHE